MGLIAIGDIHGCVRTLRTLLDRLAPTTSDVVVFVGDYVDRGPDSRGVIDALLEFREHIPCVFLRGNHEELMLDYLDGADYTTWRLNGGDATLRSYLSQHDGPTIPSEHEAFLRGTIPYYETEAFFFVHAGLKPYLRIAEQVRRGDDAVFLWERSHLEARELAWEKTVVCGHTPQQKILDRAQLICIDTGCVYHDRPGFGLLTAVRLPERAYVQARYEG